MFFLGRGGSQPNVLIYLISQTVALPQEKADKCHQLLYDAHRWCDQTVGRKTRTPHLFTDLMDMMPGAPDCVGPFHAKAACIARLPCRSWVPCNTQCSVNGWCPVPVVDIDVAGLPCTDYALSGLRKCEEGPTAPLFCAWSERHKRQATKVLLLENAPDPFAEFKNMFVSFCFISAFWLPI